MRSAAGTGKSNKGITPDYDRILGIKQSGIHADIGFQWGEFKGLDFLPG